MMNPVSAVLTWTPSAAEARLIEMHWPSQIDVVAGGSSLTERSIGKLGSVQAIVGPSPSISSELIRSATHLKLIHVLGHGVDGLLKPDVVAVIQQRGIDVARSNASAVALAEFAIMSLIALNRRVIRMHNRLVDHGDWSLDSKSRRWEGSMGGEIHGTTLGLIGYGNIGREIHLRATALGMQVGALVRRTRNIADRGLAFVAAQDDIDEFLSRCNHVVLCLPLTDETRHIIDATRISAMKDGAYLVNVGRGNLIDEEALYSALQSGKLAGVALDVWAVEEGGSESGYPSPRPLHQYNAIMTPHYAGATLEARERAIRVVGENLQRMLDGQPIENLARLDEGY